MEVKLNGLTPYKYMQPGELAITQYGSIILMSEYGSNDKPGKRETYIVGSGEFAHIEPDEMVTIIEIVGIVRTEDDID